MSKFIGLTATALLCVALSSCTRSETSTSTQPAAAPAAPNPATAIPPKVTGDAVRTEVPVEEDGGTFLVPVTINDALTLKFTIDSGAASVHIPSDVASTLIRTGTITRDDFIANRTFVLADGSTVPGVEFRIRKLQVGTLVLHNVIGSVGGPNGSLLLGQSFLSRLSSWSFDNERTTLSLKAAPGEGEERAKVAQAAFASGDELLGDGDLEKLAAQFKDTLNEQGMLGVSAAVEECYGSVIELAAIEARKRAAYCITLDVLAARFDQSFRESFKEGTGKVVPPTPYYEDGKWQARVALYLPHTGLPQSDDTTRQLRTYVNGADRKLAALMGG